MALQVYHNKINRQRVLLVMLLTAMLVNCGYAQTIIRLEYDRNEAGAYPLTLVQPSDSQYVRFTNDEDMGVKYGFSYELKEPVPDGVYEIYRNDTLELKGTISKGKKDGLWTQFYGDDFLTTTYKNGKKNGRLKVCTYDRKIKGLAYFKDDQMLLGENFDDAGQVTRRTYWLEGVIVREEEYAQGKLIKAKVDYRTPGTYEESHGESKAGGWITHRFKAGTFEMRFKKNRIIAWKLYDIQGTLLVEEKEL